MSEENDNQDADNAADDGQELDNNTLLTGNDDTDGVDSDSNSEDDAGDESDAPEAYEEFNVPEGMEMDEELSVIATKTFRDEGFTQEQSQKMVDLYADKMQGFADQHQQTISAWQSESRSDSEYGGNNFNANIGVAGKAIDQFATPAFSKMLEDSGYGNHPEMIRLLVNVGKQLGEDNVGNNGKAAQEEMSTAEIMYGQP